MRTVKTLIRPLPVVAAALTVVAAVSTAIGGSPVPLLGVVFAIALIALSTRWGYLFAGAATCLFILAGVLGSLLLSASLSVGILLTVSVVFGLLGLAVSALLWSVEQSITRPNRGTWLELGGACVGAAAWLVALIASSRVPHDERLGWLMRNDSMNNLILSHAILRDTGIVLGPTGNPVPLPAGLIALGLLPGRGAGGPELSLAHDLAGMGWTWAALIGLFSVLAGLTSATIVRTCVGPGVASRLAAIGGSLLVMSWYLTGYPIEFGFFNLDVALPILLASFLLALLAHRSPWVAVLGLAVASSLILATWSPLVLVPLALLAVTAVRFRAALWPRRVLVRVLLFAGAVQLALYAGFGALPSFLSQGSALGSNGGIYNQNSAIVFGAGAAVVIAAFVSYRRDLGRFAVPLAVVVSSWAALGVLLFLNRKNPTLWTYYPVKLAFFSTVVFLLVGFGLAVAIVAEHSARRVVRWVGGGVLAGAVVIVTVFTPGAEAGITHLNPLARVTTSHPDELLAEQESLVLSLARRSAPAVVWGTTLPYEPSVDLWLLQLHDDTLSGTSKLRILAYAQSQTAHTTGQLCAIAKSVGPALVVYTSDPALKSKFSAACPGAVTRFAALPTN